MDRFHEMQAFVSVVDAGSFVRGADALRVSKSAVSRLVADLELRLGVRLLQRTTRRLSLTREGEVFLARCRQLLEEVSDAEGEVASHAGELKGELRVSAPTSFGMLHLAPLWPAFLSRHPELLLQVDLTDRFVDLVDEGYDVAVRIARLPDSTLVSRQLAMTRLVLCASPRYLRLHGEPKVPEDLTKHTVFAYTLLSTGDQWPFDGPGGPVNVKIRPQMRSNSGDSCCEAALQGLGLVLQPSFLVGEHLRSGRLIEVMPRHRSVELGIYAVYPSRKLLAPRVRSLVDFLVESFSDRSWPD